jgi:hypothetical protein
MDGLMDGWIDGWIGYMLSRGLKPRCRSEYLGQLDWVERELMRADGCHPMRHPSPPWSAEICA